MTNQTLNSLKRFGYLSLTIIFGILAYFTFTGTLQSTVHFTGVANEIGFFIMASTLAVICAILTCVE